MITLQFATDGAIQSWLIRLYSDLDRPRIFTPSHVDLVVPRGTPEWPSGGLFGARLLADGAASGKGGVQLRPGSYAKRFSRTLRVGVPCSAGVEQAYYAEAKRQEGKPYDWRGILAFAAPALRWRNTQSWWCDNLQFWLAARAGLWSAVPDSFTLTPRDLMLVACSHGQILP